MCNGYIGGGASFPKMSFFFIKASSTVSTQCYLQIWYTELNLLRFAGVPVCL